MSKIPILEREIDSKLSRLKELNQRSEFTETETNEVEKLRKELNEKQNQLEQRQYLASLEADSVKPDEPDLAKAKRQFSVLRAIQSQIKECNVDCGLENEVSQEIRSKSKISDVDADRGIWCPHAPNEDQQRAVTGTTPSGGPGSNLIGTTHLGGQLIQLLRSSRIASMMPLLRLSSRSNLRIPKQKTGVFGKALGETASLSNEDSQWEVVTCGPPKRIGALASFSFQQMLQSDPSIESLVVSDLNQRLERIVDKLILYGQNDTVTTGNTNTGYGSGTFTKAQLEGRLGSVSDHFVGLTHDVTASTPVTTPVNNGVTLKIEDITHLKNQLDKEDIGMEGRVWITSPMLMNKLGDTLEFASSGSQPIARGGMIRSMTTIQSTAVVHNRVKGSSGNTLSDLIYIHAPSYGFVTFDAIQVLVNPYSDADFKAGRISVRAQCYHDTFKRYDASTICAWYNQCVTA